MLAFWEKEAPSVELDHNFFAKVCVCVCDDDENHRIPNRSHYIYAKCFVLLPIESLEVGASAGAFLRCVGRNTSGRRPKIKRKPQCDWTRLDSTRLDYGNLPGTEI